MAAKTTTTTTRTMTRSTSRDTASELEFLTRALKAPTCASPLPGWPNEPERSRGTRR